MAQAVYTSFSAITEVVVDAIDVTIRAGALTGVHTLLGARAEDLSTGTDTVAALTDLAIDTRRGAARIGNAGAVIDTDLTTGTTVLDTGIPAMVTGLSWIQASIAAEIDFTLTTGITKLS